MTFAGAYYLRLCVFLSVCLSAYSYLHTPTVSLALAVARGTSLALSRSLSLSLALSCSHPCVAPSPFSRPLRITVPPVSLSLSAPLSLFFLPLSSTPSLFSHSTTHPLIHSSSISLPSSLTLALDCRPSVDPATLEGYGYTRFDGGSRPPTAPNPETEGFV